MESPDTLPPFRHPAGPVKRVRTGAEVPQDYSVLRTSEGMHISEISDRAARLVDSGVNADSYEDFNVDAEEFHKFILSGEASEVEKISLLRHFFGKILEKELEGDQINALLGLLEHVDVRLLKYISSELGAEPKYAQLIKTLCSSVYGVEFGDGKDGHYESGWVVLQEQIDRNRYKAVDALATAVFKKTYRIGFETIEK